MKLDIHEEIELPEGVSAAVQDAVVTLKGPEGEIMRPILGVPLKVEGNKIIVDYKKATKNEKKIIISGIAHMKNMIKGVQEPFIYRLKICASHFPMKVNADDKEIKITNYLGEKTPRIIRLKKGVGIEIKGQDIIIKSADIEKAGALASDIEVLTRRKGGRDVRVFQDGIYIVSKPGDKGVKA